MGRRPRITPRGYAYHVVNRGVHGQILFESDGEYVHFQTLMARALARFPVEFIAHCLMSNHFHFVLRPQHDNAISAYIHWLTSVHARYFNASRGLKGHVYQSRYYCVTIADERHLWTVIRYVESNPVRAGIVPRAERWRWSSLTPVAGIHLVPITRPSNWLDLLAGDVMPGTVKTVMAP